MNLGIKSYDPNKTKYTIENLTFDELLAIVDAIQTKAEVITLGERYAEKQDDRELIQLYHMRNKTLRSAKSKVYNTFGNPKEIE